MTMLSPLFPNLCTKAIRVSMETPIGCDPDAHMAPAMAGGVMVAQPAARTLSLKVVKVDEMPCYPVQTVEEAENLVLREAIKGGNMAWDSTDEQASPLAITVVRACNTIAARTRRGAGNTVLMHPLNVEFLAHYSHQWFSNTDEDNCVGRWRHVGTSIAAIEVFTSEDMPVDKAFVSYVNRNSITNCADAAGALFNENGQLWCHVLEPTTSTLGQAADYIVGIQIK